MANIITAKIDVRKLDKSRFFEGKPDKNGHRPLYADIVLLPRKEVGKFGDTHTVKQSKKKDEQVDLPIIGNATERGQSQSGSNSEKEPQRSTVPSAPESGDVPY